MLLKILSLFFVLSSTVYAADAASSAAAPEEGVYQLSANVSAQVEMYFTMDNQPFYLLTYYDINDMVGTYRVRELVASPSGDGYMMMNFDPISQATSVDPKIADQRVVFAKSGGKTSLMMSNGRDSREFKPMQPSQWVDDTIAAHDALSN